MGESNDTEQMTIYEKVMIIILFDQITRNIFRGTSKAYRYDEIALKMTKKIISSKEQFDKMHDHIKIFLILPLIHSENILDVKLAQSLCDQHFIYPYDWNYSLKGICKNHYDRVTLFGRIPERQKKRGKENTQKEKAYLKTVTFSQSWK